MIICSLFVMSYFASHNSFRLSERVVKYGFRVQPGTRGKLVFGVGLFCVCKGQLFFERGYVGLDDFVV